ncbi:splicing factor 3B subunit 10 (SF3b10) domain-containing protein [Ditylenchus destructor]|uniref:Splicing factor 3B subunit 5 n=1 Tax=Ditylenchus destructor TaxID=166010 RepID=A0AAD4RAN8_9BILA|nr:splicing factor 3B subunit 10 (SF3b10) domain-containing protein [Ditylenchus destructor]
MTSNNAPAERFHVLAQLEHLQSKYVGTGHADISRWEWITNQHRDTNASLIGHPDLLSHVAVVENETRARARYNLLCRMIQPCGPPPEKSALDEL